MSKDIVVTLVGWTASDPREVVGDGVPYTSFRVGSTSTWFDSRSGTWRDAPTEWFTVKAFRELALNVAASVRKGQPVIVQGRLKTDGWVGEDGPRTTMVVEAYAVGHDLSRGRTEFVKRVHVDQRQGSTGEPGEVERSAEGAATVPPDDPWSTEAAELTGRAAAHEAGLVPAGSRVDA